MEPPLLLDVVDGIDPFDEYPPRERSFDFSIVFAHTLDQERAEVQSVVESWYHVAFHGGLGGYLNQLRDIDVQRVEDGEALTFRVVGSITRAGVDVLLRCLSDPDIDISVARVEVHVDEYV
jgi:hypothetical protein